MPDQQSNSVPYADTVGLILAGGTGARLGGVHKASLLVGGQTLLNMAIQNLNAQCAAINVAIADYAQATITPSPPVSFIADPGLGPAAALLFAAGAIAKSHPTAKFLLVAPCDAPFMPSDFAHLARAKVGGHVAALVGSYAGRSYPTHALWQISALIELNPHFPPPDAPALHALLDRVEHTNLAFDAGNSTNPFFNVNTMSDLLAANRRFNTKSVPSFS